MTQPLRFTTTFDSMWARVNGCCMYNCACLCLKHPRSSTRVPSRILHHPANPLYSIIILSHRFSTPGHFSSHVLHSPNRAISITARLWNDLRPELRTISLPPPPSLSITRHHLHPPPLYVTPGLPLKIKISSNTPTLTHLIIHLLHLNDTHLNSYAVQSWYSGNRT